MLPHISTFFKKENDYFYRKGYVKGLEEGRKQHLTTISIEYAKKMKALGFENSFIAKVVELSIKKVEKL